MNKPIFLIRGMDYTRQSGGIRSLHILCEKLLERGEEAYLSACHLKDGSKARTLHPSVLQGRKIVLVEPEIISGKVYDWTDLIVRWLLNSPGKAGPDQSKTWGADDLFVHFDERFAIPGSIPLVVPHVDRTIFHDDDNALDTVRDKDCFYAKKAIAFGEKRLCPKGAIDVSPGQGHVEGGQWEVLSELFRRTRTFYTMEDTATSIEAALCGARVEYIPNAYQPNPPEDLDLATWYAELEKRSGREIDHFLDICYDRVGLKREAYAFP